MTANPAGQPLSPWRDLRDRTLAGAVMATIALLALVDGGRAWWGLLAVVSVGLAVEWAKLTTGQADGLGALLLGGCAGGGFLAFALGWPLAAAAILLIGGTVALVAVRQKLLAAGLPMIAAAVIALFWLRQDPTAGLVNALFVVLLVCASDIGAYVVGRAVGGRKLAPTISPGKTVSGALGGLAAAMIVGVLVSVFAGQSALVWRAAGLAALLAAVSQAGDLAESWLKRLTGVKDSSHLIPGHGGLLDRLDALMAAAPVAALLAFCQGPGVVLWR